MTTSNIEAEFLQQLAFCDLTPQTEYRFHPVRKWRFDGAYPDRRIAYEVEGGTWSNGRHTRGAGYRGDCEKYNEAVAMGWQVYRFTADMVTDGSALAIIEKAVKG